MMTQVFCYNHSPEPTLMVENEGNSIYNCPVCHYQVKVILNQGQLLTSQTNFQAITEEEARIFIEEYVRRYQLADLDLFMDLWFEYATQSVFSEPNRPARIDTSLEAIRRSYGSAFKMMSTNIYQFSITGILTEDGNIRINGTYHIEYPANSDNRGVFAGTLSMLLSRNFRGSLQILHLAYHPTTFF